MILQKGKGVKFFWRKAARKVSVMRLLETIDKLNLDYGN
jgi:hypothetical protein